MAKPMTLLCFQWAASLPHLEGPLSDSVGLASIRDAVMHCDRNFPNPEVAFVK